MKAETVEILERERERERQQGGRRSTVASTTGSSSSAEKYRRLYDRIVIKRKM